MQAPKKNIYKLLPFKLQYNRRRHCVETRRAARAEIADALLNELYNLTFEAFLYFYVFPRGNISVPGKTTGLIFHMSSP